MLRGVRFFGGGNRTHSIVMTSRRPREVRFIDQVWVEDDYGDAIMWTPT